jgi:hypothetical protein
MVFCAAKGSVSDEDMRELWNFGGVKQQSQRNLSNRRFARLQPEERYLDRYWTLKYGRLWVSFRYGAGLGGFRALDVDACHIPGVRETSFQRFVDGALYQTLGYPRSQVKSTDRREKC